MGKDKRIRNLNGMEQLIIDIKPNRSVSDVYINQKMDLTNLVKYVDKRKEKGDSITYFYAFLAAIGKVLYNRPKLNRYIRNRHVFEHSSVVISFVAKVSFDDKAEEMMIMVPINPNDNIDTIGKYINDKIDSIRNKKVEKEGANDAIDTLGKLPNIIRVPLVGILKWIDKKGILPSGLCKDNLYYSSMIVSNLGSIKCGAIFHNITDFGHCSSLATMGEIKKEEILNSNGKKETRDICEFGVNIDERVADGYYFAKSVKMLQYLFDNPKLLEEDASKTVDMKELR